MRSIWSGSISFGLINIPIKLYSATNSKNLDFDYLHKKDLSPVRYAKICRKEEEEIEYKELVRGFEYRDGDFIVVTDEDLSRASPEKTKTIQILSFAEEDDVDIRYYEKPYYVEPAKGAEKAYYLLLESLRQSERVAVVKFLLRSRESLSVLKPYGSVIVLNKIRFEDEIRDSSEINAPKTDVSDVELEMALSLVKKLTKKFKPEDYPDTYKKNLEKIIAKKAEGKPLPSVKEEKPTGKVEDLMSLLKESLAQEGVSTRGMQQ